MKCWFNPLEQRSNAIHRRATVFWYQVAMWRLFTVLALLTAGCLTAAPARAVDLPAPGDLVAARLLAETSSAAPGTELWADVRLKVKPGWHIYWRNPGDAGLPTEIDWHLPPDFSAGAIEWPVPERFKTGDLANYGYENAVDLLVPITVPKALGTGDKVTLSADVTWLACTEICIPGAAKLSLDLPAGDGAATPANTGIFAAARARLPKPAAFAVGFAADAHDYRMTVPRSAAADLVHPNAALFPYDGNAIDQAADQHQAQSGGGLTLTVARPPGPAKTELAGVLVLRGDGASARAFTIDARPAALPAEDTTAWWEAVLLAFLGGVALNLMPCVFPILSLKVLSLATLAHRDDGLRHGVAYTAGVVLSFALLGGILLALREGGMALGWGFQLQSPVVVGLLAYLLLAMGLSLSGVAEFGAGLAGTGASLAERDGLAGAFAAGVLATIVATPCTAPFMGTALGFALVAPAPVALAVFVA